jgi:hypothetical protein
MITMNSRHAENLMPDTEIPAWLVMFLLPTFGIALSAGALAQQFTSGPVLYEQEYGGDIVATFDRIVDEHGLLIGIRAWPVADRVPGFLASLEGNSDLGVFPGQPYVDLYFDQGRPKTGDSMGDQSLVGRIYRSSSHEVAMAVDLEALGVSDADAGALLELVSRSGRSATISTVSSDT